MCLLSEEIITKFVTSDSRGMQKTSSLPDNHPVRALTGLAKQIALPHEYSPERFPSFPALERTALMGFNAPTTLPLPASTAVKIMVARQAGYPVWAERTFSSPWSYQVGYHTSQGPASTAGIGMIAESSITEMYYWVVGNSTASTTVTGATGSSKPFSYPPLAVDSQLGGEPWLYVPAGCTLGVFVGEPLVAAPVNVDVTVNFEAWRSPGQCNHWKGLGGTINTGFFSTYLPQAVTENTWIRPTSLTQNTPDIAAARVYRDMQIHCVVFPTAGVTATALQYNTTQGSINLAGTPTGQIFLPLIEPAEFVNSTLPWYSTRTTAAAFLGTNVSQVINKGGTVLGGRVAPQVENPFTVGSAYITQLHPAEKAYLPLESGVYTYVPPSTDLADFWDYTLCTSSTLSSAPVYRLDNTSLVNVMFLTASAVSEFLACNVDWHVEFRTSSALFQIGLSAMTLESFHQAQLALAAAGFFFENPEHKAVLGRVIEAVRKIAPSAIGMINPLAGKAAQYILSSKPKKQVKTTTLEGSGYTGPKSKNKKEKGPKTTKNTKVGNNKKKRK